VLVTLPEETPVNELVDTAYSLEDEVGVSLGPVVVNGLYPLVEGLDADPRALAAFGGLQVPGDELDAMAAAAGFRRRRARLQGDQLDRLDKALPLPQLRVPHLFATDLGPDHLEVLVEAVTAGITELDDVGAP
jgi:hypothetical protein